MANKELQYQEDEIDLKQLFGILADRKWFIAGITGFITVLAVAYALLIPPTYQASISFVSPSQSSVVQLNKVKITSETSETIFRQFLNNILSSQFQKKVFETNDYLNRLNPENKPIDNYEDYINNFTSSIQIEAIKIKNDEVLNYEKPIKISMDGSDAVIISSFLNDLARAADMDTINEFLAIIQQKIDNRVEEIAKQKILLLSRAKQDRLSQINRIKEEDQQKINEINDRIDRLRIKAEKYRLNQIQILSDAATIASTLGIIGNNFKTISDNQKSNPALTVTIGDNQELPKWYLYGKDALLKEIETLKNRINNDPYIPEILSLQDTLQEIQSNQTLRTLESREDDSPFIAEINKLDIESSKLKSYRLDSKGINAMQINLSAYPSESPIKPKKKLIVAVAFIAGLMLSIFLVFIMNVFRKEEDKISA